MAETFLTLTNKTLVRMNEVELTSSTFLVLEVFNHKVKQQSMKLLDI